ncbi:hypothetical protein ACRAWD_03715 [Caulobacter segnis]
MATRLGHCCMAVVGEEASRSAPRWRPASDQRAANMQAFAAAALELLAQTLETETLKA